VNDLVVTDDELTVVSRAVEWWAQTFDTEVDEIQRHVRLLPAEFRRASTYLKKNPSKLRNISRAKKPRQN
jgi:hypothetical protein